MEFDQGLGVKSIYKPQLMEFDWGLDVKSIDTVTIPQMMEIEDDIPIAQELADIRVPKEEAVDFSSSVQDLILKENQEQFCESLPVLQGAPVSRNNSESRPRPNRIELKYFDQLGEPP
jgi:hypothetical protein